MARRWQIRDGKALYDGRPLAEWVDEAVADMVRAADPVRVVLFGSVARGDDGPDSDLDFLVILERVTDAQRPALMSRLRLAIRAPVPIDVFVADQREFDRRKDAAGSLYHWPAREGRVVYERAA
jgi:uncharacterized protein